MAKKSAKPRIVAFKVEEELADFLDKLPNKSDFIRRAIISQFGMACPLCNGGGVVPRGLHTHYAPVIAEHNQRGCERCKTMIDLPMTLDALDEETRPRIEQFFRGGPLYCTACYPKVPPCEDCGWHVSLEKATEHFRQQHLHG